jgi:hypothetical protein
MKSPDPPQIATQPDPLLQQQEQAAQAANIAALTQQAQGDTASLMARYGTRLALSSGAGGGGGAGSPLGSSFNPFGAFADAAAGLKGPIAGWMAPMAALSSVYAGRGASGAASSLQSAITNAGR